MQPKYNTNAIPVLSIAPICVQVICKENDDWYITPKIFTNHIRRTYKMSVHPSLKTKGAVSEKRNVLKRYERIDQLKKEGRYKDGDRAWGLPKTKPQE